MTDKGNRIFTKGHRRIIFAQGPTCGWHPLKKNTVMLDYFKTILTRVSFNALLFEKELRKALKTLIAEEISELRRWCYEQFRPEHEAILNRCFVSA